MLRINLIVRVPLHCSRHNVPLYVMRRLAGTTLDLDGHTAL